MILLEALIGIVIFSIGILGLVAMQATSIRNATDSKYRSDASALVAQIIGQMWLDRSNLASYAHNPTGNACAPTAAASTNANVTAWLTNVSSTTVAGSLPGAASTKQQIIVNTASNNQVTVRLCWTTPQDSTSHRYEVVTNIN